MAVTSSAVRRSRGAEEPCSDWRTQEELMSGVSSLHGGIITVVVVVSFVMQHKQLPALSFRWFLWQRKVQQPVLFVSSDG